MEHGSAPLELDEENVVNGLVEAGPSAPPMGLSAKQRVLMRRDLRKRMEAEQREDDLLHARQRYFQERVLADNVQRSQYLGQQSARVVGVR